MAIIKRTTKLLSATALAIAVSFSAAYGAFWDKKGNGSLQRYPYNLGKFQSIEISGDFELIVKPGPQAIDLTIDSNLFDAIQLKVKDEKLFVDSNWWIKPTSRPRLILALEKLESIKTSGSIFTKASFNGFGGEITLKMSGSSTAELKDVSLSRLAIDTSGSARIAASGKADQFNFESSGSVTGHFEEFDVNTATVQASGESTLRFGTVQVATGHVSGSNTISFIKSPDRLDIKKD